MAELYGVNLGLHLESILAEFKAKGSIYGYPKRKMYLGFPDVDFSVDFHDRKAATLLGPASGPHSQMVQNIVLAFLGGGRIMELKTVQILDELEIPRPCIDIRNIGFNVEWSQELRLEDSFNEYVGAWVLLKILEEMEILGVPQGSPFYDTIFDISVGYDLKGVQSPRMHKWLTEFKHAEAAIQRILDTLPPKFARYKNIKIDPEISNSVTLSTFHGCPGDEIGSIVKHLIREHGFHVIVKMNPTILGYEFVEKTLHEDLGYKDIVLDPKAFDHDVSFEDAVAIMKRLETFAEKYNVNVGAKFTNTLVVKNNQDIFSDEVMYLSGAPLHVLAMNAMHQFRTAMGDDFHISFSAGITKHNFADTVLCNMRPITTCTDLLKEGGYTRLFDYLRRLKNVMEAEGCTSIHDFILSQSNETDVHRAGVANSKRIVPALVNHSRYHQDANRKAPPKIDSHLELFDCITCNKCLPVCPNAANFSIPTGTADVAITNYRIRNGEFEPVKAGRFVLNKKNQIANLADFCNDCGDC
ncbi:glutamate synthase, partial [candidate division KSB1 bacterium]|nr:glutamate synthase [candidate division KSB1 bacterium]NIR73162.1 glutamate synthase [candidate division KSB1 bacterium]NIS26932.1 glutamate synthase [candidate division KSB1 bacterium]NIT73770.1 glutamate synthase [candidate division KSB1 bacterium]NIU27678.1 glutamate synthase [candidate division KSB1 bacterium]